MTSARAFRKAISNLHFDLVVSKLLRITAALSRNRNRLAAPQDCERKPPIYPRRKLEKGIKPRRGKSPFLTPAPRFLCPPLSLPIPRHTQTTKEGRPPPRGERSRQASRQPPPPAAAASHPEPPDRWTVLPRWQVMGEAGRTPHPHPPGQEDKTKGPLVGICVRPTPQGRRE